ncbi:MAG: ABC transporter permease [Oscillospiraceae bacterium]|nr:ABC transporter permease [Oscillospiraceae bacterium]
MWKTIARRILILIPQLIAISILIFILGAIMPGDAISGLINPDLPLYRMEEMREQLGLNAPLPVRYFNWLRGVMQGDFGRSFQHHRPVTEVIGDRMGVTFALALYTVILTYLIAIPLGIVAGKWSGKIVDKSILLYVFLALATPTIVLGILMIFWFSPIGTGTFPLGGTVDSFIFAHGTDFEIFMSQLHHLTLPAITGALLSTVGIVFMLRANIIDRKGSDYVVFAKSKGVPSGKIFSLHIFRNSLVPIMSGIGLVIAGLFTGSIFIERIFQVPGIGLLFLDSVSTRDFTVANALIMLFAVLTALGILLSDILLTIVDPRIRIK